MSKSSTFAALIFQEERFRGRLMDDEERIQFRLQSRKLNTQTTAPEEHKTKHNGNDSRKQERK